MKHPVMLALLAAAAFAGPIKPHYTLPLAPDGAPLGPTPVAESDPRIVAIRAEQVAALARGDRAELKRLESEVQAVLIEGQAPSALPAGLAWGVLPPGSVTARFDGPDAVLDTGTLHATAADYGMDGAMYAGASRVRDTSVVVYRSTDHGVSWSRIHHSFFSSGGVRVPVTRLGLCAGEGDSAYLYVFCMLGGTVRTLLVWRGRLDGSGPADLFAVSDVNDTVVDFTVCRDYTGNNYWLYAMTVNGAPGATGNGRYLRSTNYGRTWALTDIGNWCREPHYSFGAGSWLHHALPQNDPNPGQVYLFFNRVFGASGLWDYQVVWPDTFPVSDPVVAPAFTLPESTAAVWTLFSHDYQGSGDWDMLYAWSTSGGRAWVDWDYLSGDYDSLERFADLRNFTSPGNSYVNGSYIWESNQRKVFRHYANSGDPSNWSDTTLINVNSAGTGRATRPLLVYSAGGPGTGAGCVFVGAGLRNLYFNSPWLVALHERRLASRARSRATAHCTGLLDLAPYVTGPAPGPALFDAAGRRVMALGPGANWLGRLSAGVYHVRTAGGAPLLRVVLMR